MHDSDINTIAKWTTEILIGVLDGIQVSEEAQKYEHEALLDILNMTDEMLVNAYVTDDMLENDMAAMFAGVPVTPVNVANDNEFIETAKLVLARQLRHRAMEMLDFGMPIIRVDNGKVLTKVAMALGQSEEHNGVSLRTIKHNSGEMLTKQARLCSEIEVNFKMHKQT